MKEISICNQLNQPILQIRRIKETKMVFMLTLMKGSAEISQRMYRMSVLVGGCANLRFTIDQTAYAAIMHSWKQLNWNMLIHMLMQTHTPKAITTKHYIYTHFSQSRVARTVRKRQPNNQSKLTQTSLIPNKTSPENMLLFLGYVYMTTVY